ncbi:MAG: 23S rRNA (uracil(1939)-C(5))-methyltransferase RlmD [Lachnospiraceae bacterium]|nr:23S rRNA (uracil(1939)-C(5))-methyltransferase RlmD [Lachnospiraceae bacterium]
MKKGQELTGKVLYVNFPNKAVIETEEGLVTAKNALPGQEVKVRVIKNRKGKPEASVLEVIKEADDAVKAQCPHFGQCGGCTFLTMTYEKELKLKQEQAKKLLDTVVEPESYVWEPIKASPVFEGYRNKMEFSFGDEYKDGPLSLGMHKRGSFYDVVMTDSCYICDEDYRKILKSVRDYWADKGYKFFHKMRHEGYLRHLLVRKAVYSGEIMVALVTSSESNPDLTEFTDMLLSLDLKGKIVSILHTINDSTSDVVQSDRTDILYGRDYIEETILGLKFKISEFSFFQTNSRSAEVLYSAVRDFIGDLSEGGEPDKIVYDLYSGTGTITQLMSPVAKKVIGVEIVEEAVLAARDNTKLNGINNCEFICGDVLKAIDDIDQKPDFIILDPPRDGIHPKALPKILNYGVDRIVYISCKLTSLIRDLEPIQAAGYKVERAVCVDQFPWTGGIETIVLLSKK